MNWENINQKQPNEDETVLIYCNGNFHMATYSKKMGQWFWGNNNLIHAEILSAPNWVRPIPPK